MQGLDHGREHESHGTAGTADEDVADAGVLIVQGVKAQLVGTDDPCSRTEGEPHSPAGFILADVVADDAMAAVGELVAQAQGAGQLRPGPTREIATVIWVLLHGFAALQITGHLHEPRTIDGNEHLADLLDLALEQLRPV